VLLPRTQSPLAVCRLHDFLRLVAKVTEEIQCTFTLFTTSGGASDDHVLTPYVWTGTPALVRLHPPRGSVRLIAVGATVDALFKQFRIVPYSITISSMTPGTTKPLTTKSIV
jgi:hypothetical protein